MLSSGYILFLMCMWDEKQRNREKESEIERVYIKLQQKRFLHWVEAIFLPNSIKIRGSISAIVWKYFLKLDKAIGNTPNRTIEQIL